MKKSGLSQETLKIIACVTMLIDHVGATVVESQFFVTPFDGIYYLYFAMRIIGRVAFPIYCFLLAEGAHYTHNPRKYALRLFIGALLSEPGFDIALFGGWTWENQSVMVTLLLGFGMVELMKKCPKYWMKLLAVVRIRCGHSRAVLADAGAAEPPDDTACGAGGAVPDDE